MTEPTAQDPTVGAEVTTFGMLVIEEDGVESVPHNTADESGIFTAGNRHIVSSEHPLFDLSLRVAWAGRYAKLPVGNYWTIGEGFWLLVLAEKIGQFDSKRSVSIRGEALGTALFYEDKSLTVSYLAEALWAIAQFAAFAKVPCENLLWRGEKMPGVRLSALLSAVLQAQRCGEPVDRPLQQLSFALQTGIVQRNATVAEALLAVLTVASTEPHAAARVSP